MSTSCSSKAIRFLAIAFILQTLNGITLIQAQRQQLLPDNPLQGRIVFEQKGCINCHAVKGDGAGSGPDLGKNRFYGSFLELAGIMLNHAPEMLRRMRELDLPYPEFTRTEIVELIAYLYYLRYLGEPGNLYRGKVLVSEKGCIGCHSIRGKGGDSAPPFDRLSRYISPLYLAQALWNHAPRMEDQLRGKGMKRPKFEKGEIVDLSAYIRSASSSPASEQLYMSPGNPVDGKKVFTEKKCVRCHDVVQANKRRGPVLGELDLDRSVTEIAALMWNHGSEMGQHMKQMGIAWPRFDGKEMADLIAYLYFLRFEDIAGDPKEGRVVFKRQGCVRCHGDDAKGGSFAPDLSKSKALSSHIDMALVMWNHTPIMEEKIIEKVMHWPEFSGADMRNLHAYLHSLGNAGRK